jgi:hypothetical protein
VSQHHYHIYAQIQGRKYRGGCAANWATASHMLREAGCPLAPDSVIPPQNPDQQLEWQAGRDKDGLPTAGIILVPGVYSECTYNGPEAQL